MKLTARQLQAQSVIASDATHCMLFGGSRSGKTFLLVRTIILRALKSPKSRHAILRFRFNAVKASVVADTFPKVMDIAFPDVAVKHHVQDGFVEFPNGSQIWFGGLDDKERTEKILGQEYVTIYLNEASQIPFSSRELAVTRLAQLTHQEIDGEVTPLKPRMLYDANPPAKSHWTYRMFIEKNDPDTRRPLSNPENYVSFRINPEDNVENVTADYLQTLKALSPRLQKRFLKGEFADATPNALFTDETIEKWRVVDGSSLPEFVRVVVSVDPSGSGDIDNADNDAIGIVVVALGTDGNAYVLEDCTVKAGPATWGTVATSAFDRHQANVIVGEVNYGGAMVQQTIQTARPRTPYKAVTASRGKAVRAEPFSALYENGKVRHVGEFREMEDELTAFSTVGYVGSGSPNRADALIWGLSELFPALTKAPDVPEPEADNEWMFAQAGNSWMRA